MTDDLQKRIEQEQLEAFKEYFRKNYPGPDTIISDPDWHAPKIYRAALHASGHSKCQAAIASLQRQLEAAEDAAGAYRDLCACYRVLKKPPEKLFDRLHKASKYLDSKDTQ